MNFKFIAKHIFIFFLFLILFLNFSSISLCEDIEKGIDLYPVLNKSRQLSYIDEKGNLIVEFQPKEFDYFGNFSEGKVFLVKKIKSIKKEGIFEYISAKLYIMNEKGKIIKKIPYSCIVGINQDLGEDDIPEFYNNKAIIKLQKNKTIIVDDNGDIIKKDKDTNIKNNAVSINIDYINTNKKFIDNVLGIFPSSKYKIDESGPFPYLIKKGVDGCNCSLGCINYADKNGKIVIKLNTCNPGGSCDYTIDPYFYNGIAMVFGDIPNPTRRFINNKKGEYITSETYLTATPFWKKLASVVTLNGDYIYIDSKGKKVK